MDAALDLCVMQAVVGSTKNTGYCTTTPQSDYGENLNILLDFQAPRPPTTRAGDSNHSSQRMVLA